MMRRRLRNRRHVIPAVAGWMWLVCLPVQAQLLHNADLLSTSTADDAGPFFITSSIAATNTAISSAAPDGTRDLPDAPIPQNKQGPPLAQQEQKSTSPGFPPISPTPLPLPAAPTEHPGIPSQPAVCVSGVSTEARGEISCRPAVDYFQRFVDSGVHPLTPRQKAILAYRSFTDPFNFATIALVSAVSVASDPNSPYGAGMPGFARNFGVATCETAVGTFFGVFLIPSLTHQDPHYHRMPNASYPRRTWHAITATVVAQSDYGEPMPNYANLFTTAIGDGLGNVYVPGREKGWGPGVARYATSIATDPINNFITEFLPDVARHVNVRIVLVQRVIDRTALQY